MKVVLLLALSTLLGAAMLGVGIAGAAGAFDSDDSDSSSASSSSSLTDFDKCPTSDARFDSFTTYRVTDEDGDATLVASCKDSEIEVSMLGTGLTAEKPRTVAL